MDALWFPRLLIAMVKTFLFYFSSSFSSLWLSLSRLHCICFWLCPPFSSCLLTSPSFSFFFALFVFVAPSHSNFFYFRPLCCFFLQLICVFEASLHGFISPLFYIIPLFFFPPSFPTFSSFPSFLSTLPFSYILLSHLFSPFSFSLPSSLFMHSSSLYFLYLYLLPSHHFKVRSSVRLSSSSSLFQALCFPVLPSRFSLRLSAFIHISLSPFLPPSPLSLCFCACCFSILCRELSCDANYID